jgi:hypothetical protein
MKRPMMQRATTNALRECREGLIERIPHTNSHTLTPEGVRFATTYTKLAT